MEALYSNRDAVYSITACLEAEDCLRFLGTTSALYAHCSDDRLWRHLCSASYGVVATVGPDQAVLPSYRATFNAWRSSFARYPASKVRRVFAFWNDYSRWAVAQFPEVVPTLNAAASDEQLDAVEAALQRPLPDTLRLLYRFHAGQATVRWRTAATPTEAVRIMSLGMFGGYMFYDHLQTCYFLSLDALERWSSSEEDSIVFAGSYDMRKRFSLTPTSVEVNVDRQGTVPCHPPAEDPLLAWLEEFVSRVRSGAYCAGVLRTGESCSDSGNEPWWEQQRVLLLCPETQELGCSIAVTQGIQVKASAAFVPELSSISHYQWTYSIRIRAIREQCPYTRVQLTRRRWLIQYEDGVKDEVDGEAVVGMYPKFGRKEMEEGFEFVYASASRGKVAARMSGHFTFVPGTKDSPTGEPFDVEVAPFDLQIPHFIF